MKQRLTIGYSPCPNDTFIFHALAHNHVRLAHIDFAPPLLADVETLNQWALQAKLDVTKLSFHALGHVGDRYVMLGAGAALGRGCGPLLVSRSGREIDPDRTIIAIPGRYTTAALLLRLYAPRVRQLRIMPFAEIMDAVACGEADCGVIIHESRFTYQAAGLVCLCDLGQWWEESTGLPVPLGCIAARRSLPEAVLGEIEEAVRASLGWARRHPGQAMPYIRRYAREMDQAVMKDHIDLYVNDFSMELGPEGKRAVKELMRRGQAAGIFSHAGTSAEGS
jgi:1,4-dihydroxy-6-naphthoate synthase